MTRKLISSLQAGVTALFLVFGLAPSALGFDIEIDVAPNVLNLQSED